MTLFCFILGPLVLYSCYGLDYKLLDVMSHFLPSSSQPFSKGLSLFLELVYFFFKAVIYGMSCSLFWLVKRMYWIIFILMSYICVYIYIYTDSPVQILVILLKIISSSCHNCSSTLKKKIKFLAAVTWLSFAYHCLSWEQGTFYLL